MRLFFKGFNQSHGIHKSVSSCSEIRLIKNWISGNCLKVEINFSALLLQTVWSFVHSLAILNIEKLPYNIKIYKDVQTLNKPSKMPKILPKWQHFPNLVTLLPTFLRVFGLFVSSDHVLWLICQHFWPRAVVNFAMFMIILACRGCLKWMGACKDKKVTFLLSIDIVFLFGFFTK